MSTTVAEWSATTVVLPTRPSSVSTAWSPSSLSPSAAPRSMMISLYQVEASRAMIRAGSSLKTARSR